MKSAIIYTTAGLLIIVLAVLFSQFIWSGYHNDIILDKAGNVTGRTFGLTIQNTPLLIWFYAYNALGLGICVCGAIQFIIILRKKTSIVLTLIQISLGVLVIAALIFFLVKAEPSYSLNARIFEGGSQIWLIQKDPAWLIKQILWKEASFIPPLIIIGCGIMQLVKLHQSHIQD